MTSKASKAKTQAVKGSTEFQLRAQDAPESRAWVNREVAEDATMVLEVRKSVGSRRGRFGPRCVRDEAGREARLVAPPTLRPAVQLRANLKRTGRGTRS
jgi:hypothetical protein